MGLTNVRLEIFYNSATNNEREFSEPFNEANGY